MLARWPDGLAYIQFPLVYSKEKRQEERKEEIGRAASWDPYIVAIGRARYSAHQPYRPGGRYP